MSNFDLADMEELAALPGGAACATNQIDYSLNQRGAEWSLLPWQRERAIPAMAYSPIDQGALAGNGALARVAERLGATAAQVALAWVMAQPGVIAIPKTVREARLRENLAAAAIALCAADLAELDRHFPPPTRQTGLAMR